jgi:type I restriction enzyme S subunit
VKAGWKEATLGEVCTLQRGFDLPVQDRIGGDVPLISSSGPIGFVSEARVPGPGVATGRSGSIGAVFFCETAFWPLNTALYVRDFHGNDARFIWYLLQFFDLSRFASGTGVPTLNRNDVHGERVAVPTSVEEQQQIVAVLDEAFEGLARARAHSEANLRDARELFENGLREKIKPGKKWRTMLIGDTTDRTKVPSKIQRKDYLHEGEFPIVSQEAGLINGYWNISADVVRVERPLVVFGDHTRALKYVDFDFVVGADGTQLMCPISVLDPLFYFFALRTVDLAGKGYARHYSHLKKETIWFPEDTTIQKKIAADLEEMEREVFDLEARYATKIRDLDALRQSLLQKAFAGELT